MDPLMTAKRGERLLAASKPTVQVGYLPFNDAYLCRLPYVENSYIVADGTTGLSSCYYTYRGNNMYDPRVEIGGNQPLQYDTLATVYRYYRVYETHVELTFSNPTSDGMWVGYRVRNDKNSVATTGRTIGYLSEMANTEIAPLNNTGSQTKTFKFAFRTAGMCGTTEINSEDYSFGGKFDGSSVPAITTLIEPFAVSTVVGENPVVRMQVKITYHAHCFERQTVPES